jgi:tetratricopeptide (TPR) repeat protein
MVAQGAFTAARREASIATDLEPENPRTWQTLGGIESDLMDSDATIRAWDKALETARAIGDPEEVSAALLNRGVIAVDTRDYDTTRAMARELMEIGARKADAWYMLAMVEYRKANHEKSIEYFQKALALGNVHNEPLCHWNYSLPLQAIGRIKEGWKEHAWGEKEQTLYALYVPHHRFAVPKWRGDEPPLIHLKEIDVKDQDAPDTAEGWIKAGYYRRSVVHVHAEAGFGDNIAVWRYLPLIQAMGYEVHYETYDNMLKLAQRNLPGVKCMPRSPDYPGAMSIGLKDIDYHVPIGDIAGVFETDIDTIPWSGPYIKADPELSAKYAEKLAHIKGRKIGLCWSSGIRKTISIWMERYGRMKSMTFEDVRPLLWAATDEWYISLQVGEDRLKDEGPLTDVLPEDPSWEDTAALIDNLDLVITVDTGVAHLAGAMGKPCWVMMMRDGASWHFMCWRPGASWNEASPWYPSIRLFRQHEFDTPGYWKDVVTDVARALSAER